jgi:LacI family transcriptional regulator
MKRPTQADVARIAGVSMATVSYVINDRADDRVSISAETRLRVMKAVEKIGYVPDSRARSLRSGDTKIIGLVIPDIRNPHFWDNVDGVEQELRTSGYHLLLSSLGQQNEFGDQIYKDLTGQRIDGLILMGTYIDQFRDAQDSLIKLIKRRLPIVELSDYVRRGHNVDQVVSDYRNATNEVMSHLLSLGHRRIGMIYGVAMPDLALDRLQPYQQSLHDAGLPVDRNLVVNTGPAIEDGYRAALQVLNLPSRPTAVIAINDLLAIGAIRAAADLGLQIPADLSLVGYDDIFPTNYLVPRLSTVSKDAVRMGREAVRLVLERIRNPDLPRRVIEISARFIIRESIGPAPS